MSNTEVTKTKKSKGPIRFEAIVPTLIVVSLIYAYGHFFFDNHLRKAISWSATQVHGAEVNVGKIRTSFIKAYFEMYDLQVTDKNKPTRNLIQIGKVRFELLWDALLRAKMVVNDATIENIQALVPRKKPGYVLPPEAKSNQTIKKVEEGVLNQAKEDFNENVLGDVATVMGGTDTNKQLKAIQMNLKSDQKVKELESLLDEKKKLWDKRLKDLPQKQEIDALVKEAESIKIDTKNPVQMAKDIERLNKVIKKGDKIYRDFSSASKDLQKDIGGFDGNMKSIDQLVKDDLKDLQRRLKIPDIDVADFSKGLFGKMFSEKVAGLRKYMAIAREYMPPKKTAEQKAAEKEKQIIPRARGAGRDIRFPITTGYPVFWLKHAAISSEPTASEYSGKISGTITDVSTNPSLLPRPMLLKVQGDFPKQKIFGLDMTVTVDHRSKEAYEKMDLFIDNFPVGAQKLANSKDAKFIITKAQGQSKVQAVLKDQQVYVKANNQFLKPEYEVDAKNEIVKDVLEGVARDLPNVTIDAAATGTWSNLKWQIDSNLGREIGRGLKKHVQAKIDEAKKQLEEQVFGKINAEKAKLQGEFNKIKGQFDSEIDSKKQELEKAKKQAKDQVSKGNKQQSNKLKKQGEKALKDLKKSLGW